MTAAELRVQLERLGLSGEWLAERFSVALRTVRRWESGDSPVPAWAAAEIHAIATAATATVEQLVTAFAADAGEVDLLTYRTEQAYQLAHPDSRLPVRYHRAIAGRVQELVPGLVLRYAEPGQ